MRNSEKQKCCTFSIFLVIFKGGSNIALINFGYIYVRKKSQDEKHAEWQAPKEGTLEKGRGDFAGLWQGFDTLRQAGFGQLPSSAQGSFSEHMDAIEQMLHNADPEREEPWRRSR